MKPARYFPVLADQPRLVAGLHMLGDDFGNGVRDGQCFQRDDECQRYLTAKAAVPAERHWIDEDPVFAPAHEAALDWIGRTLAFEGHPVVLPDPRLPRAARWRAFAMQVQEDLALLHRGDGGGRMIALDVCFPSGWRPETLRGASFSGLHAPVPGFADERISRALVAAMVDRGPHVRFVWTVTADDALDHHPGSGLRVPFGPDTSRAWLRVERQTTIPLRDVDCGLFLIRTYLRPFESLSPDQRTTLAAALRSMPREILVYKELDAGLPHMLRLLGG